MRPLAGLRARGRVLVYGGRHTGALRRPIARSTRLIAHEHYSVGEPCDFVPGGGCVSGRWVLRTCLSMPGYSGTSC